MNISEIPREFLTDDEQVFYKDSTTAVVSTVAYLLGVPHRIFENEFEPPKLEVYKKLELDKNARIIRNLCMLRTAIERNFKNINDKMRTEFPVHPLPAGVCPPAMSEPAHC